MPVNLTASFSNPDTLTGVDIEAAKQGATVYLRHAVENGERALAISLQEFDCLAREVARWRVLQNADVEQAKQERNAA